MSSNGDKTDRRTVTWNDLAEISPIERAVVFLLAFAGDGYSSKSLAMILSPIFNGTTLLVVDGVLERLAQRKFPIRSIVNGYKNVKCHFFTGEMTCDCALRLIQAADVGKWWPSVSQLAKVGLDDGSSSFWGRSPDMGAGRHLAAVLGLMRLFVLGTDADVSVEVVEAFNTRNVMPFCRAAAYRLAMLLPDTPAFAPSVGRFLRDGLFLPWLNMAFCLGRDVRPVLHLIASEAAHGARFGSELLAVHAALCVWIGWPEGLSACGKKCQDLVNGCLLACKGNFAKADIAMRGLYDIASWNQKEGDYDNLPVRLLYHTVCMAGKPVKVRSAKSMRGNLPSSHSSPLSWSEDCYLDLVKQISQIWNDWWKYAWDGDAGLLNTQKHDLYLVNTPLIALAAWSYHRLSAGRSRFAESAQEICDFIPRLGESGYINLAGLLLSLMAGAYTDEQQQTALAAMEKSGLWFIPRKEPDPEWKNLLSELSETVAKDMRASEAGLAANEVRRLVWKVNFRKGMKVGENQTVVGVRPVIVENMDWGERRKSFHPEDLKEKFQLALATPADRLLLKILVSNRNYYWGDIAITSETIEQLCGMPNLEFDHGQEEHTWSTKTSKITVEPITFERQPCCLESTIREDGGVSLALPGWIDGCDGRFVIRRIEPGRYAYIPITDTVARIAKLFSTYGMKGKVEFPKEAMTSAQTVLQDLEKVIPLANPNSGKTENLPRVEGASECCVRLDFVEGVLSVRAVVRPIAGNAALVVEPGLGLAEKLVCGAAGSYWLVRNLDAERLNFQTIHTALAGAEEWFDGRSAWQIDDMQTAIESLVRLKALEPAVTLEWIDMRRLNVVNAPKSGVQLQSSRTADEWFSVKGTFALDDGRVINVLDLLASMSTREGRYVRLSDGDYVALTKSMAKELDALASVGRRKGGALEVSRAALPMLDDVFDGSDDESIALPEAMAVSAEEIRNALHRKPKVPAALQATLRPYQTDGYIWLSRLAACGFGSCLADDMGLGKTVQVIALLLERIADGVSLVVAPSSVCGNWRNEIRRFAPTLNPVLALECADEQLPAFKPGDVVIASYGYLLFHENAFAAVDWNGLVLDEAQAIKNEASKRAHLVKRLHARFRVAATGTPVENHLGELWSLFDFLNPGLLGPITAFAARFVKDGKAVPALKKVVKPLILRRLKGDVLDDLPEKTEVTIPVELGKEERSAYEGCRLHALAALADKDSQEDRFSILAELTRLRRFCCHPSLVLGEKSDVPSAKMEALVDLLESLHQGQHKALVFSQFTDYLRLVQQVVSAHGWSFKYLDGSTPTKERERLVNEFQTGDSEFFLISLKAGGTGLNLTAANYVILLDPWWNPAVENQAADRAHRIGQKQPVTVYRLVASDTVEERVIELHKQKTALAADLLEGTAKSSFTPADLIKLFAK